MGIRRDTFLQVVFEECILGEISGMRKSNTMGRKWYSSSSLVAIE